MLRNTNKVREIPWKFSPFFTQVKLHIWSMNSRCSINHEKIPTLLIWFVCAVEPAGLHLVLSRVTNNPNLHPAVRFATLSLSAKQRAKRLFDWLINKLKSYMGYEVLPMFYTFSRYLYENTNCILAVKEWLSHRDQIHRASLPAHACNAAGKICTFVNLGAPRAESVRPSCVSCWYTTFMIFWSLAWSI